MPTPYNLSPHIATRLLADIARISQLSGALRARSLWGEVALAGGACSDVATVAEAERGGSAFGGGAGQRYENDGAGEMTIDDI